MKIYCIYSLCVNSSDEWLEYACSDFISALSFYKKQLRLNCDKNYYYELREYNVPESEFNSEIYTLPRNYNIIFTDTFDLINDSYLCNYDLLMSSKDDNN